MVALVEAAVGCFAPVEDEAEGSMGIVWSSAAYCRASRGTGCRCKYC